MMMRELREILVFLSYGFKYYMLHLTRLFLYFMALLVLIILAFFASLRLTASLWPFLVCLCLVLVGHLLVQRTSFRKHQIRLNRLLIGFLEERQEEVPVSGEEMQQMLDMIKELRQYPALRFSPRIRCALAVLKYSAADRISLEDNTLNQAARTSRKYSFSGYLLLLLLLIFFSAISLLFTLGLAAPIKILIFTLGFVFAYSVYLTIIDPLVYLLVQQKFYRRLHTSIQG
jgi:hypothetical protein